MSSSRFHWILINRSAWMKRKRTSIKHSIHRCFFPLAYIQYSSTVQYITKNNVCMQSQAQFNTYLVSGTVLNNYAHIFDILIRLRQAVDHPYLVIYSDTQSTSAVS